MSERSLGDVTPKSYPRRCAACGNISVQPASIVYDAEVRHEGKLYQFQIADLAIDQCETCQEQYFTNSTDDQISAGLRSHLGLLAPEEIRQQLGKLGLTQREFAEHLRVSQESISRWLTGGNIQSRSMDTLMRLYFRFANVREALSRTGLVTGETGFPSPAGNKRIATVVEAKSTVSQSVAVQSWSKGRFSNDVLSRSATFRLICPN